MKNIILAIASFVFTVVILSQVAIAADDDGGDPSHTNGIPGSESSVNETGGGKGRDQKQVESGVSNPGNNCPDGTCFKNTANVDAVDPHNPTYGTVPAAKGSGPANQNGTQKGNTTH